MRRTPTTLLTIALPALLAGCEPDPNEQIFDDYGVSMAGEMTYLCGQQVRQGEAVSRWDAFASSRTPEDLLDHYLEELGQDGLEREDVALVWRLPPGATPPERVITIQPAAAPGPHRFCTVKPSVDAPGVIILARRLPSDSAAG